MNFLEESRETVDEMILLYRMLMKVPDSVDVDVKYSLARNGTMQVTFKVVS